VEAGIVLKPETCTEIFQGIIEMPNYYEISPTDDTVNLRAGKGTAAFTVRYTGQRPVDAQAQVVAVEGADSSWLTVEAPATKRMAPNQTQTFQVEVEVPQGTPAGRYALRLDMMSVDNTDEEYDQGPPVWFEVAETEPPPPSSFPWWLVILVALLLALLIGGIVWYLMSNDRPIITDVSLSVTPTRANTCPTTFNFTGEITVDAPTTVTYRWERSDGATAPDGSLTFDEPGSKTITGQWRLGAAGTHWRRLHVLTPEAVSSEQASFTLRCRGFGPTGPTDLLDRERQTVDPSVTLDTAVIRALLVHQQGTLAIQQTFSADLDAGTITSARGADIFFQARTATERFITPRNGAVIAVAGRQEIDRAGCAALNLRPDPIPIQRVPAGTYLCVRTNDGRLSRVRVDQTVGPSPGVLRITFLTWAN